MQKTPTYALGYSDSERERLVAQSLRFAPVTERFLRDSAVREGHKVLDIGSGLGDVAIAAARIVRTSGSVIGIERNADSIAVAQQRVAAAGHANVRFIQGDVTSIPLEPDFDAAIGRLVLEFIPNPVSVIRRLRSVVRPGGIIAFQEPCFRAMQGLVHGLPFWSACVRTADKALQLLGADPDAGALLYRMFQDAGLPAPFTRLDVQLDESVEVIRWPYDVLLSVLGSLPEGAVDTAELDDLQTLLERMVAEVRHAGCTVPGLPLIGAWSRVT
jgi:SAM-dependent methyltransferase